MLFWVTNAHKVRKRRTLWKNCPVSLWVATYSIKEIRTWRKLVQGKLQVLCQHWYLFSERTVFISHSWFYPHFSHIEKYHFHKRTSVFQPDQSKWRKLWFWNTLTGVEGLLQRKYTAGTPIGGILEKISIRDQEEINIPCISKAIFPVLDNYM